MSFSQWQKMYAKKIKKKNWSKKKQKEEYNKYKKKLVGKDADKLSTTKKFTPKKSKTTTKKTATKKNNKLTEEQKVKLLSPKNIGLIGSGIVFTVSEKKVLTFQKFERTTSGRWADHERLNKKPLKQFLGGNADTISLTITQKKK